MLQNSYHGICFRKSMTPEESEAWIDGDTPELPALMIEMFSIMRTLAVQRNSDNDFPEEDYLGRFAHAYQRLLTPLIAADMGRGMTLGVMIRLSFKAAKSYARCLLDMAGYEEKLAKRCSIQDWRFLSTTLQHVMQKFDEQSAGWTADDVMVDLGSASIFMSGSDVSKPVEMVFLAQYLDEPSALPSITRKTERLA